MKLGVEAMHYKKHTWPGPTPAEQAEARKRGQVLAYRPNYMPEENSGGYVGLYSASTNLSSVDLLVLVYHGKVQAILQRPGALPHRPRLTSASPSP
jgi:hypothetical protein